jgi:hypothetical protein
MTFLAALLLSLEAGGSGQSDEALAFDYLRQARMAEFSAWAEKLPEDSPLSAHCRPWSRRLVRIQTTLVEAINRGGMECELKEIHPESARAGKITGASATTLDVQDGDRRRTLIWAGLPSSATYALAQRYLREEAKSDPALLRDWAEALGLPEQVRKDEWAADLKLVEELRAKLSERSVAEAKRLLAARRKEAESESPSLTLIRLWLRRLDAAVESKARKMAEAARTLPEGGSVVFLEDFEGGPELVPAAWVKGDPARLPGGATTSNQWCLKSTFQTTQWMFGELVGHFDFKQAGLAPPALDEDLYLACRLWGTNARTVSVIISSKRDGPDRNSRFDVAVEPQNQWVPVLIRLGDVTLHRPVVSGGRSPLFVGLGDEIHVLRFEANREDGSRREGYFCVDDLELFRRPQTAKSR